MPLESCTGGHGASKSSRNPKTVDYSPRKWPKNPEITRFDDAARVMHWWSRGIEILPEPKNRGLYTKKMAKNPKITSFDDVARVMYRGSRGIEILPQPENPGL